MKSNYCIIFVIFFTDFSIFWSNFYGWLMSAQGRDLFFPEEDEMLKWFKQYLKEVVGEEKFED